MINITVWLSLRECATLALLFRTLHKSDNFYFKGLQNTLFSLSVYRIVTGRPFSESTLLQCFSCKADITTIGSASAIVCPDADTAVHLPNISLREAAHLFYSRRQPKTVLPQPLLFHFFTAQTLPFQISAPTLSQILPQLGRSIHQHLCIH